MSDPDLSQVSAISNASQSSGSGLPMSGAGIGLPKPGKILKGRDVIPAFRLLSAISKMKVNRDDATPNDDGSYSRGGEMKISGLGATLALTDPPSEMSTAPSAGSGAELFFMQVQSYTVGHDYLSAKIGTFTSGLTTFFPIGSAINVALPWLLRVGQRPSDDPITGSPIIWPAYAAGDILLAYQIVTTAADETAGTTDTAGVIAGTADVTYQEVGNNRAWAYKVEYLSASGCAARYRYVVGGPEVTP